MHSGKLILLGALVALALFFIWRWWSLARAARDPDKVRPPDLVIGFGTNFFDTLGIGSFAPTTALFKFFKRMPDERIPGTLNVGHALPTVAQALVFITIVNVGFTTLISMIVAAVLVFVMARTPYGRRLQAVGGNRDAAIFAGIPAQRYIMSTFVIAGVVAGLSSLLLIARGSGSSPGIDERLMVDMVLATFLGAAFTRRGTVTVAGSVLGALFVALLSNGLILSRVANAWVDGFKGVLILLVVAAAAARKSEEARA